MKINVDLLLKMNACDEAVEWFVNEYGRKSVDEEVIKSALKEYAEETGSSDPLMWIDWGEKRRHAKDVITYWKTHTVTSEYKFVGPKHEGICNSVADCKTSIASHLKSIITRETVLKSLNPQIVRRDGEKRILSSYTPNIGVRTKILINSTDGQNNEMSHKDFLIHVNDTVKNRISTTMKKYTILQKIVDADGEILWDRVGEKS